MFEVCTDSVDITDGGSDTRQTSTSTWDDADVFVRVLALLVLAVGDVVQVGDRIAKF